MHIAHSTMTAAPVIQSKQQFYFQKTITEKISMGDFQCHNSESAWSLQSSHGSYSSLSLKVDQGKTKHFSAN